MLSAEECVRVQTQLVEGGIIEGVHEALRYHQIVNLAGDGLERFLDAVFTIGAVGELSSSRRQ